MTPRALLIVALLFTLLPAGQRLAAQEAPPGSCMLPSGEWCWPIAPLTYGDPCECPKPDGTFEQGVVQ
ncbi:hypothetical protein AB2B41_10535 [Marimonas sp. MJW-29]|uniref:Uncharacterized protein n=1 Tax=Sulfitobacter sediminis TaxID=3234186 RepID=A0ABV3RN88_9RHOB